MVDLFKLMQNKLNARKMNDEKKDTEQLIFEAASRVFQRKGYGGARMQEIADEADINKSMLHYYYRSKDRLFQEVYQRKMSQMMPVVVELLTAELPLNEKIEQLVDAYYSFFCENPQILAFAIHEMNVNPDRFRAFIEKNAFSTPDQFDEQIEGYIADDKMDPVDPRQLMVSIVSLTLFPFVSGTMIKAMSGFDDEEFSDFMSDRKTFIKNFVLNGINYKK